MAKDLFARFVKADQAVKQRVIWAGYGMPGSGKTHFALTAPAPIVVFSLDRGLEGVVEPFQKKKDIYVAEYDWSPTEDLDQQEAIDLRDKFTEDFEDAVQKARTVVWDKETDVWELFRYAEFGAPNDAPRNYPALNQRYRRLINMAKAGDINFGCLQGMKAEWASKVNPKSGKSGASATGAFIRAGFGELEGLVHVDLMHRYDKEDKSYIIEVGKSRGPGGFDVQGETLAGIDFPTLAQMVFPESSEEDWE